MEVCEQKCVRALTRGHARPHTHTRILNIYFPHILTNFKCHILIV
jgi:hypothetical protein